MPTINAVLIAYLPAYAALHSSPGKPSVQEPRLEYLRTRHGSLVYKVLQHLRRHHTGTIGSAISFISRQEALHNPVALALADGCRPDHGKPCYSPRLHRCSTQIHHKPAAPQGREAGAFGSARYLSLCAGPFPPLRPLAVVAYSIHDLQTIGPLRHVIGLPLPRISSLGKPSALSVRQRVRGLPERGAEGYTQAIQARNKKKIRKIDLGI